MPKKLKTPLASQLSSRTESTRQQLIAAGLDVFASVGYSAATTRMIAAKAKVNLAAIPYHFGGKEGLYNAVVQMIVDTVTKHIRPELEASEALLKNPGASPQELFQAVDSLVRSMGQFVIGSEMTARTAPIVLREQMQPTAAFEIIYRGGMGKAHKMLCRLAARLLGRSDDDPEAIIRAHSIIGQVLVFRVARELFMRQVGWKKCPDKWVDQVLDQISENCFRIFFGAARRGQQR